MPQPLFDTLTRSEALALRGYSPEVIAGNGHVEAPPEVETEHGSMAQNRPRPGICSECPEPLPAGSRPGRRDLLARVRPSPGASAEAGEARQVRAEPGSARSTKGAAGHHGPPCFRHRPGARADWRNRLALVPDLLGLLVTVAGQLPPGWRAELGAEGLSLRWAMTRIFPVPEDPERGSELPPAHMRYLVGMVDEAGAPLEPLAGAVDRLVEACTEAVGPPVIDPETGCVTWHCDVTDVLGDVFNREPLRGQPVPRAEREAWLANRVAPCRAPTSPTISPH